MSLVECQLSRVVMSEGHDQHVVVLQEKDGDRKFPIIIGLFEVYAIHRTLNDRPPPRPMTHELLGDILRHLNVNVERVIINDLRHGTFFGRLILSREGETFDIDSRPSDAIAIAVQGEVPIFVEDHVLAEASQS
jgi:hypothetical protein